MNYLIRDKSTTTIKDGKICFDLWQFVYLVRHDTILVNDRMAQYYLLLMPLLVAAFWSDYSFLSATYEWTLDIQLQSGKNFDSAGIRAQTFSVRLDEVGFALASRWQLWNSPFYFPFNFYDV